MTDQVMTACAMALALLPFHASATEIAAAAGQGNSVRVVSIATRTSDWLSSKPAAAWSWTVGGEWQLAKWSSEHPREGIEILADGSLTAVLTLKHAEWKASYLEAGFGLHLLSEDRIGDDRDLGWLFQFGEFIGAGANFGSSSQYAVGLRLQHVSNGSLKPPNDGLTFVQGVLRYRF
jgi:lipid A 3-O-deacylase